MKVLSTFCSNTNIHGFIYTVQPTRHKIEKFFWSLMIFVSFGLTVNLIHKLFKETQKNPVVIYTDQNLIPIEEIDFPAVTICLGLQYKNPCWDVFDYENITARLNKNEMKIEDFEMNELKLLQVANLIARDGFVSSKYPDLKIPTDDFLDVLNSFTSSFPYTEPRLNYYRYQGNWLQRYLIDTMDVLTDKGICHTFNLPDFDQIYKEQRFFGNTTRINIGGIGLNMNKNVSFIKNYPVTAPTSDTGLFYAIKTSTFCHLFDGTEEEIDPEEAEDEYITLEGMFNFTDVTLPKNDMEGFILRIHDPYEVASKSSTTFNMQIPYFRLMIDVTPRVFKIDDSLADEDIKIRNCYLPKERQLEFFKIYTKINCEHECLTQLTLNSCGCVQFFMNRNMTTKICGTSDEKCFMKIENSFEEVKSTCKCLDPCNNIKYDARIRKIDVYHDKIENTDEKIFVEIVMATNSVFALHKKKSKELQEFFSFIGGILGLFAGFSVITGFEVLYYFLIYPIVELWKKRNENRVFPFHVNSRTPNAESKIKRILHYIKKILRNSTIHSFSQFASDKNSLLVSITWLIIFIISMIITSLMTKDVYKTYKNAKIVMSYEGSPTRVEEIPFPAVTFTPDREIFYNEKYSEYMISKGYNKDDAMDIIMEFILISCTEINDIVYMNKAITQYKYNKYAIVDHMNVNKYLDSTQPNWFKNLTAHWNNQMNPPIAKIKTSTFNGYTFNMIEELKLLKKDAVSSFFRYKYNNNASQSFPWKTSANEHTGLSIEIDVEYKGEEYNYKGASCLGYNTLSIHSPYDYSMKTDQTAIEPPFIYDFLIIPEIIKADQHLRYVDIDIRKCYFENERRLKFFEIYTQKNCELECLSYIIYAKCDCIPLTIIHQPNAKICDFSQMEQCVYKVEFAMNFSSYDNLYPAFGICQCLPQCNYIKYSYELYVREFKKELNMLRSLMNIKWKDSEYYAMIRHQQMNFVDFLSYVGGILGLFAGISVLSVVEVLYFLTLRLATDFIRYFRK